MESAWLEDFIVLERTRNFTRAAELRHTTQPAFSRRIQRLEEWIGATLIQRDARPVAFTAAGQALAARAVALRENIQDLRRIVASAATGLSGALKIYTTNTLAIGFLPEWIRAEQVGEVSVIVSSTSTCLKAVENGQADVAFIPDFSLTEETLPAASVVGQDELVLVHAPSVSIRLEQGHLAGPFMAYAPGTMYGRFLKTMLAERGVVSGGQPVCESASAEALLAMARNGLGAAWVPRSLLQKDDAALVVREDLSFSYSIRMLKKAGYEAGYQGNLPDNVKLSKDL